MADLTLIPEVLKAGTYPLPSSKKTDPYILYAWLAICESIAVAKEEDRSFDAAALELKTGKLEQVAATPVNFAGMQQVLSDCGIRFHLLPPFQKLQVRGFVKRNQNGTYILIMPKAEDRVNQFKTNLYKLLEQIKTEEAKESLVEYEIE